MFSETKNFDVTQSLHLHAIVCNTIDSVSTISIDRDSMLLHVVAGEGQGKEGEEGEEGKD